MVLQQPIESVVDCSVALKWKFTNEPFHTEAVELLLDIRAGAVEPVAPTVFIAEVGSALLRAVRQGRLNYDEAIQALNDIWDVKVVLLPITLDVLERAYEIAWRYQQGFFDCLYVAVAEVRGAEFWTGDR
ncbi:MAG: type II toxin-antitoxin system VapC family toxin, partial [Armatimonadota bacterium]|nr:type II toxin-antitoxin system VapC family toxin [Armatimonadota bacterium]MDW8144620.1 type II toxin-antitoxin system VapC family toxin [Armatimonadota bacterium]